MEENSKQKNKELINLEEKQNLLSFFELLLEIDIRDNPQDYKNSNIKKDDRYNNPTDTNKS